MERTVLKRKKKTKKHPVFSEKEYDPEGCKKRVKSWRKMVDVTLKGIDWKMLEKHLKAHYSDSDSDSYSDSDDYVSAVSKGFFLSTRDGLKLMFDPSHWAPRRFFYMYNHYIYTEPCTPRQPPVVDSLNMVHQNIPKIAAMARRQAVNDTLELVARESKFDIATRGGCQTVDYVRTPTQLRMTKIAGMARKGSFAGTLGLVACYASSCLYKPAR